MHAQKLFLMLLVEKFVLNRHWLLRTKFTDDLRNKCCYFALVFSSALRPKKLNIWKVFDWFALGGLV